MYIVPNYMHLIAIAWLAMFCHKQQMKTCPVFSARLYSSL